MIVEKILTIVNLFLYLMNIKKLHMLEDTLTSLIQGFHNLLRRHDSTRN